MPKRRVSDHVHTVYATPLEGLSQHLSPEPPATVFRGYEELRGGHAVPECVSEADNRAVVIECYDRGCPRRQQRA